MKYLRTYENLVKAPVKGDLPMYYIYREPDADLLVLLEVIDVETLVDGDIYHIKRLYRFTNNNLRKLEGENADKIIKVRHLFKVTGKNLIYSSSSLEDCLNKMPVLLDSDKYNI